MPFSSFSLEQKQPVGNTVDKIISGYQVIYGGQVDEDVILSKCRNAISYIQKVDKEIGSNIHPGIAFILLWPINTYTSVVWYYFLKKLETSSTWLLIFIYVLFTSAHFGDMMQFCLLNWYIFVVLLHASNF